MNNMESNKMPILKFTLPAQRFLLGGNAIQLSYIALNYISGTLKNKFPVLERLFTAEVANTCTVSGCWQSIVPFLSSTYISIAIISILALFFRPGRELRLVIFGIASVNIVMATIRLSIVPSQFYLEGAAMRLSAIQIFFGSLLVISSVLPYANTQSKNS